MPPPDVVSRRAELRLALGRVQRAHTAVRRISRQCDRHTPRVSEVTARLTHAKAELSDAIDDTINWSTRANVAYGAGVVAAAGYVAALWLSGRPVLDKITLATLMLLLVPQWIMALHRRRDANAIPRLPSDLPASPVAGAITAWSAEVSIKVQEDIQAARDLLHPHLAAGPHTVGSQDPLLDADHTLEHAKRATTLWPADMLQLNRHLGQGQNRDDQAVTS